MLKLSSRAFILGLFCLSLVFLFWLSATLDASRIEKSMYQILEAKGRLILEAVDSLAKERIKAFMGIQQMGSFTKEALDVEEGFRIQDEILQALYQVMQELPEVETSSGLDSFKKELEEKGIYAGVIEEEGQMHTSKSLDPKLLQAIKKIIDSPGEFFFSIHTEEDSYYILRKRKSSGTRSIVLVLDSKSMETWALKVALKESIELGWREDLVWISLIDPSGNAIVSIGDAQVSDKDILEISHPFSSKDNYTLKAGIEISNFVQMNENNKRRIIYTTIVMSFFSILLVIVFYWIQLGHSRKMEAMKEQLMREQRLSSLGKLAAGIAHEIRNPLNAIAMAVQRLHFEFEPKDWEDAKEFKEILVVVKEQIKRLNSLVDDFTSPMRREIKMKPQNIVEITKEALALLKEELAFRNISVKTEFQKDNIIANVDKWRFEQVVLNIVKNAWEAMGEGGEINITVRVIKGNRVAIEIRDTGRGIPREDLKRIFEMEYTTKEKGLGLGLPMSNEILKAHGGEILVESELEKGTTFTIILPIWEG